MAISAGVDMQFYDFDHDVFQRALIDCVQEGSLSEADLNRAVSSVLRVKFVLGLFDHPYVNSDLVASTYRSPAHLADSLQSARESITLLKNDGGLLTLPKSTKRIAVIGPNGNVARYGGYEKEYNGERISVVDGIRSAVPKATVTFDDGSDVKAVVEDAKQADVVILALGEWYGISGEGHDRTDLGLPSEKELLRHYTPAVEQEPLLEAVVATGKPAVLVLENGHPLTICWAKEHVPAIVEAWYPGEFGGKAVAETLFGDNNPSGHLTITFPANVGQLPDFYNSDPSRTYKYVDNDGDEIAQPYVRENVSSVEIPSRSLAGFSRVHLKPGETRTVHFQIPQNQLAIWNADHVWAIENGNFTLRVGDSSLASLQAAFRIEGGQHISSTR